METSGCTLGLERFLEFSASGGAASFRQTPVHLPEVELRELAHHAFEPDRQLGRKRVLLDPFLSKLCCRRCDQAASSESGAGSILRCRVRYDRPRRMW